MRFSPRTAWLRTVGKQLGHPSGPLGAVVARVLNRGNRGPIAAAIAELELTGTETVADVGFGGGIGLDLLLAGLGGGLVHGVDPSTAMIERARKAHASALTAGRLTLHEGTMEQLPFGDGALDGWITLNTVYFAPDLAAAAHGLRRVLTPTGRGVVGIADPDWMGRQAFTQHGFRLRPVDDIIAALEVAGLEVERRTFDDPRATEPFNLLVCRVASRTG
ncbi:methyltransferase domain-containing protein [Tsukamurella sp. 8F]|uniref:class I SAM-dependent methyltransferase n=1 Tax=unclassified Tsukamurella TaxID=2633480 RepID=UPI0023B8878B|nr:MULTISPECIES: methyltransferase domain-containing protein [unclassified Tsukamurella]MDF0532081.1 methyltransferase domain-containing protein [Tsukamurella sp. 8J]MDF0589193.1 methyltransferase domain-containing protein [Tsukamurella sp. 8F]